MEWPTKQPCSAASALIVRTLADKIPRCLAYFFASRRVTSNRALLGLIDLNNTIAFIYILCQLDAPQHNGDQRKKRLLTPYVSHRKWNIPDLV